MHHHLHYGGTSVSAPAAAEHPLANIKRLDAVVTSALLHTQEVLAFTLATSHALSVSWTCQVRIELTRIRNGMKVGQR